MEKKYVLSIDQSTQGTKALLLDEVGNVVAKSDKRHKQITNDKGYISHDPEVIYKNVLTVVKQVLEISKVKQDCIVCVGICNQRETSLIWNKETGAVVDHAVVWQCARGKSVTDRMSDAKTYNYIKDVTGIHLSPYFPAAKYAWLFEEHHLAKEMASGKLCCGTMDSYLLFKLTGHKVFKCDYSNAARTQLFDISKQQWDEKLCRLFHVNPKCLPEVCDSDALFGWTDFDGLLAHAIPIHAILGDSNAALFGQGCLFQGDTKATYGTGSSIMMNTGNEIKKSNKGLVSSIAWKIEGELSYVLEGNVNYSGAIITWLKDDLKLIDNPEETATLAKQANQADTTYLVPAFSGLGAPYWESEATASIRGMTRLTGRNEIVKAGIESIGYQVNDIIEIMKRESNLDLIRVCVDGGATTNTYLMQFQSDIANIPIYIAKQQEVSAIGVGYLAGIKIGLYDRAVLQHIPYNRVYTHMDTTQRKKKLAGWKRAIRLTLYDSSVEPM